MVQLPVTLPWHLHAERCSQGRHRAVYLNLPMSSLPCSCTHLPLLLQAPHGTWKGMMAFPPPLQATYIIPPTPLLSLPKPWPPTHTTSTHSHTLQSELVAPKFKLDTSPSLEDLILPSPHPASGSHRPSEHLTSFLLTSHHHPTDEGPVHVVSTIIGLEKLCRSSGFSLWRYLLEGLLVEPCVKAVGILKVSAQSRVHHRALLQAVCSHFAI